MRRIGRPHAVGPILDLLAGGKRVGVTANSHKVISNPLAAVCEPADAPPVEVRGFKQFMDNEGFKRWMTDR